MDKLKDVMSEEELDRIADGIGGGDEETPGEENQEDEVEEGDEEETLDPKDLAKRIKTLESQIAEKDDHISRLNEESKDRRLKLKKFEDDAEADRKKEMDEIDRLKEELEEATSSLSDTQAQLRTMKVQNQVRKLEVTSEEKTFMLIDPEDFVLPADKEFEDIPAELKALFKQKPHYFREAKADPHLSDDGSPRENNSGGKKKRKPIELPRQKL